MSLGLNTKGESLEATHADPIIDHLAVLALCKALLLIMAPNTRTVKPARRLGLHAHLYYFLKQL